jgi:hypothetical protein
VLRIALLVMLGAVSAASANSSDPLLIVPWRQIGQARLGAEKATLDRLFGSVPGDSDGQTTFYSVPGGTLDVGFDGPTAVDMSTENPGEHTADGLKIGAKLPLGPCRRTASTSCQRRWHGLVYHPVDRSGTPAQWLGSFCDRGIHGNVRVLLTNGVVSEVAIWYDAGVCGSKRPRQPLTAHDRTLIRVTIQGHVGSTDTVVTRFRVAIEGKRWASAWLSRKNSSGAQPVFVVLEHRGRQWHVVDLGTRSVGCGSVPIKPLTQIGGGCGMDSNAP